MAVVNKVIILLSWQYHADSGYTRLRQIPHLWTLNWLEPDTKSFKAIQ